MRHMLSIPDASDRGDQAESGRCPGCSRGEEPAGDECLDGRTARTFLRLHADWGPEQRSELAGRKARCHISPGIPSARSAPKRRSLERFADGDEVPGPAGATETERIVTDANLRPAGEA